MTPPREDGVSEADPHPSMILWPSFKQMAQEAGPSRPEHDAGSCLASDDDDEEFEFTSIPRDSGGAFAHTDALFPVFDLDYSFSFRGHQRQGCDNAGTPIVGHESEQPATEEHRTTEGSDYCLWRPKTRSGLEPVSEPPALAAAGKSMSTGGVPARSCPSSPRQQLSAARRSQSDGARKFWSVPSSPARNAPVPSLKAAGDDRPRRDTKVKKVTEMDMATAHRLFYSKQDGGAAGGGPGGGHATRRSYLPYRKDLVGFFAGGTRFLPF